MLYCPLKLPAGQNRRRGRPLGSLFARRGGSSLEAKRENFSRKRAAILAALREASCHPTAEWVYQTLKPQYPGLSLATVYRNLNHLRETGQVVSLGSIGGYERFDGELRPHAHLVCRGCGAVVDLWQGVPGPGELAAAASTAGCRIDGVSVTYTGLCPACVEKEEQSGAEEDHI